MDKIIEKLYDLYLNNEAFPLGIIDNELSDREWRNQESLLKTLTPEQKNIFLDCVNAKEERHSIETRTVFISGFKTAIRLITESIQE